MKNLFTIIRQQIIKNEVFGKEKKFTFYNNFYPERIILFMTKQKAFKIAKVTKKPMNNGYQFTIEYKDVYTGCDFLSKAFEALQRKEEYKHRKGYYNNESVVNKFGHINDEYRDELICKNFEEGKDLYEHLEKADDCTFELFLQSIGFNNFEEYLAFVEKYPLEDKDIDERYRYFLNEKIESREYAENYLY
jgi:hypothetical protein